MISKLEGFKYFTPLDLNTGYYDVRISAYVSNMCMVIIP